MLVNQENYEAAEKLHRRALSRRESLLGKEHPHTLYSVWGLASVLEKRRQYQLHRNSTRETCAGLKKSIEPEPPDTLRCDEAYSSLVEDMRRNSDAENASVIGQDSRRKLVSISLTHVHGLCIRYPASFLFISGERTRGGPHRICVGNPRDKRRQQKTSPGPQVGNQALMEIFPREETVSMILSRSGEREGQEIGSRRFRRGK